MGWLSDRIMPKSISSAVPVPCTGMQEISGALYFVRQLTCQRAVPVAVSYLLVPIMASSLFQRLLDAGKEQCVVVSTNMSRSRIYLWAASAPEEIDCRGLASMSKKKASLISGSSMRFRTKPGLSSETHGCLPKCWARARVAANTCMPACLRHVYM